MSLPSGDGCTVGVDVGTTAVKAVAVDAEGRVVARARVPHRVGTTSADSLEHDAAVAWRRGPRRAFASVTEQLDGDPAGVVVTSMVPSITAVNRRGTPLLPGLLYGDVRARADAALDVPGVAKDDLGGERDQGRRMVEWAVGEQPGAYGYWDCQAVATHALAGVPAVDAATAMSFGGLFSRGRWDAAALDELGIGESQLPVVGGMGQKLGSVPGTSTAFAGGSIDAFCEQIVAGASPGDVLVIFGATLIAWVVTDAWKAVPGLTTLPNMVEGQVQIGGPSNAGALFADWVGSLVGVGGRQRGPRSRPPAVDGARPGDPERVPVWLPYLRGERTPFYDHDLRASLHGLDIAQGPEAVMRAAHEASGFVIRRMVELAGVPASRIVATGGGSRSVPWMQAVADATGLPVDTTAVSEGAALGAAYLARMAAGFETTFDASATWAGRGARIEPDPVWVAAAGRRYEQFAALSPEC